MKYKCEGDNIAYGSIKELLSNHTIAELDKFLVDNKKITLKDFVKLQETENKQDAKGSASSSSSWSITSGNWSITSGEWGSASNSGDWSSSFNSGYGGSASNSGYMGSASNSGYMGLASNSGDMGSASNSGNWGLASNSGYSGSSFNSGYGGSASNSGDWSSSFNSGYGGSAFNSGYRSSSFNSGYGGSASNSGNWGLASNSGDWGSASNSGDWGVATSNAIFGTVSNKANHFAFITEFIFNGIINGEWLPKEKIVGQNAKMIKFTKAMAGKFYTLYKKQVYEVIEVDNIKTMVISRENKHGLEIITGIEFGNDIEIYNEDANIEKIKKQYIAHNGIEYSHGDTIKEVIADLRHKIGKGGEIKLAGNL